MSPNFKNQQLISPSHFILSQSRISMCLSGAMGAKWQPLSYNGNDNKCHVGSCSFNEVRLDETPSGGDHGEKVHIPGSAQQSGVLMRWSGASKTAL